MQQSHTLSWREPSTDITTISNYLREGSRTNRSPWSKNKYDSAMSLNNPKEICLSRLSLCRFSVLFSLPAYFLPILLQHFFCFCHIVLWLPCVILLIPTFPFHFVFPTCSPRAWSVVCNWLDDITCTGAACLYWRRQHRPGDSRIVRAIDVEPGNINCVIYHHVVWEV